MHKFLIKSKIIVHFKSFCLVLRSGMSDDWKCRGCRVGSCCLLPEQNELQKIQKTHETTFTSFQHIKWK